MGLPALAPKSKPRSRAQRNERALANARAVQRAGASESPASRTAPAPARRKSGPAAKPRQAPSPVARVLNSRGMPVLDRILRGPIWVVMLGGLLAGIVYLNVSVLETNRTIARTDAKAAALERVNSTLRERVSKLDSGERIQELAAAKGFVMPQPGEVTYVRPHRSNARLAAQRITAPNETTTTTTTTTPTATTTPTTTTPAPTTTTPASTPVAAAPVTPTATTQVP